MVTKYHHLLSLVYSLFVGGFSVWLCQPCLISADPVTAVAPTKCLTGWTDATEKDIPKEWINDGYCDCPFDGKDEPDTNACSGSMSWAGVATSSIDKPSTESKYVCPHQSNLMLPLSRLHDGICDCCDGSDEDPKHDPEGTGTDNLCPNDCEAILKAERERKSKIESGFLIGSRKREIDIQEFGKLRTKKLAEVSKLDREKEDLKSGIGEIEKQIKNLKQSYVLNRLVAMGTSVAKSPMASELLSVLEFSELEAMLVHVCQVAGEIAKSDNRINDDEETETCMALRVAGLDLGMTWNDSGSFVEVTADNSVSDDILEVVFQNALDAKEDGGLPPLRWKISSSSKNRKGGRRLDKIDNDYTMHDDEYSMEYETEDDYIGYDHEDSENQRERDRAVKKADKEEQDSADSESNKLTEAVRTSLYSATRVSFLSDSQEVIDEIGKILDALPPKSNDDDESDDDKKETGEGAEAGDSEEEKGEDSSEAATIDRDAYTIVRDKLHEQRDIIETGLDWGASAMDFLSEPLATGKTLDRNILERILIGTIFYGQISALQVWQIFQAILPEYKILSSELDSKTCASPWAGNCPPKHIYRDEIVKYPPSLILQAGATFCDEEASKFGQDGAAAGRLSCQRNGSGSNIGYIIEVMGSLYSSGEAHPILGYLVPTQRNSKTDQFRKLFEPVADIPIDVKGLSSLEEKRDANDSKRKNIEKTINDLWKTIGGKDGNDFGRDGEYHAIADKCFDIKSGKYTYEMCVNGKASQNEGKSSTNLGTFKGYGYDEEETEDGGSIINRLLKWENGAKCWNGPKRSATLHLQCGPDHKIVSANEPDTCRYVFEMQTPLACDESYKRQLGL